MNDRFKTLAGHFFSRFFDKESLAPDGDERANVVQIVAMLAVPGAIVSLFTLADHAMIRSELTRLWLRAGDRYVFVSYSMVVMGFVMTFKWDSLFPDRRDYLILTPLPISLREFFAGKVVALFAFLMLFIVAINLFSCLIVPYVYLVRDNRLDVILPSFVAHTTAVLGGAAFTALFFGALQGVFINLMSPAAFRRVSPWVQMISMAMLVTVLLITPGLSTNLRALAESDVRALDYIPLFWFLGVYEVLNPEGTLIPASYAWALTAIKAMVVVAAVFVLTYLVSYRRYSRKILEGIESDVFAQRWPVRVLATLLNATLLRHPFQRASFYFMGRIFGRSPKHRLFLSMYSGVGLAIMISSLFVLRRDSGLILSISREGLMEAPLILAFFIVSGLRATFNIPYELSANWMFQTSSGSDAAEFLKATRKWVLMRGIVPVYAVLAAVEFWFFEPLEAAFHLAFGLAVAAALTEFFFFNFNKVPFTCSYLPAKSHLAFLAGAYLYGFTIFTFTMGRLERWVGESALRSAAFFAVVVMVTLGLSWYRRMQGPVLEIIFEDEGDPLVRQLNLTA
jgi:hypothetical protein